jgi:hypothetical protein
MTSSVRDVLDGCRNTSPPAATLSLSWTFGKTSVTLWSGLMLKIDFPLYRKCCKTVDAGTRARKPVTRLARMFLEIKRLRTFVAQGLSSFLNTLRDRLVRNGPAFLNYCPDE